MATKTQHQARVALVCSILLAVATLLIAPVVGGSGLDFGRLARQDAPDWQILINLRIPRTLLALLTGGALAASGALFQALLRDALATPSNLGVSAAASLGAVFALVVLPGEETGIPLVWLCALAATGAVIAAVSALRMHPRFTPTTLLLTGVAVNGVCLSIILLLHSLAGIAKGFQVTHWLMGGIDAVEYRVLLYVALAVSPVLAWTVSVARVLNVMSYGDTWAAGRGIDTRSITWKGFLAGALLSGITTAVTGPIAFVGLIVPHLIRRVTGPDHRVLMPACIFCGGAFLAICDTISRTVLAPVEIPVGVITALLGGPFFVWLLWSR